MSLPIAVPPPVLPEAERLADEFAERLIAGRRDGDTLDRPLAVTGPATAGKTATLEHLHAALLTRDPEIVPLLVGAPPQAPDAAPLVVMQLAEGLRRHHGIGDEEVEEIADPGRSWAEKVARVRGWLAEKCRDVVILCDEPVTWLDTGQPEFAERVEDLWQGLLFDGVGCATVIAGRAPRGVKTESRELSAQSDADWVIEQLDGLRQPAEELRRRLGQTLQDFSPLDLRLIVALAVVDGVDRAARWYEDTPLARESLATRLFERMRIRHERWEALLDLWIYLACVRRPFEHSLLERSASDVVLGSSERAILREALLFERGDRLVLHETLRTKVLSQLGESRTKPAHDSLADYFAELYEDKARDDRRLDGMEAFDHASRAGRDDLGRFPAFFVEQLNLLGYRLSRAGRRDEAAEVFLQALKADSDNDYANHYRAFNLDLLGKKPREVERRYRDAIRLNDRHPWWHSRLISFLVIRGRFDAARTALETALPVILPADREAPPRVYREVHLDVAANLVHRGHLSFARYLLDLIPQHVVGQLEEYDRVHWIVDALLYVQEHGQYVPLGVAGRFDSWWVEGPFVVPADPIDNQPLVRWLAGTVEDRDGELIYATMAEVRANQSATETPIAGELVLTFDQLEEWRLSDARSVLDIGDFIELGFYGEDEAVQRAARQPRSVGEVELPRVLGNPNRFLAGDRRDG